MTAATVPASHAAGAERAHVVPRWEKGFALGVLLMASLSSGPFHATASGADVDAVSGSASAQASWALAYLVAGAGALLRFPRFARALMDGGPVCALVGYAALSVSWAESPEVALKRVAALVGSTLVAFYLAARLDRDAIARLALYVLAIGGALSVVAVVVAPDIAVGADRGVTAWQGLYGQKNQLGRYMALGTTTWLAAATCASHGRTAKLAVAALCLGLVVMSRSATAFVLVAGLSGLLVVARMSRLHRSIAVPAGAALLFGAVALAAAAASSPETVLGAVGRDTSMTGRGPLWVLLWEQILRRPWFGHGYGAFWLGWDGPSRAIWARTWENGRGWLPPGAHNGPLDLLLDLGVVGLALYAGIYAVGLARALRRTQAGYTLGAVFPLLFLGFLALANATESSLVAHNSFAWVVFVVVVVQLRAAPRRAAARAPEPARGG